MVEGGILKLPTLTRYRVEFWDADHQRYAEGQVIRFNEATCTCAVELDDLTTVRVPWKLIVPRDEGPPAWKSIRCIDCRRSEHANFDEDVKPVLVRDPETKHIVRHGHVCATHRGEYDFDGYEVRNG